MATAAAPSSAIALRGAPDSDIGSKDAKHTPIQAMYLEMSQDIVDELLESARSGRAPQILFGRTPQLKYGDKSHILETASENFRYELYRSSGADGDNELAFTGLINHSLAVQKAEEITSGVDTALEQLKSSMAAMAEMKEANKTVVGDSSPMYTPGHRRLPSKNLKSQHLKPSSNLNSPLRTNPSSPAMSLPAHMTSGNTRKAGGDRADQMQALRHVIIHLISMEHLSEDWIVEHSRSSHSAVHEILPKLAKKDDAGKYFLTDKAFKDLDPYNFPYKTDEDRQKTIDNAIRAFNRLRLPKDDKHWQILLPLEERGKGKCLSQLNVQAPAAQTKPSTPLHKIKATEKKPAASQKSEDKDGAKEGKKTKEVESKKIKVAERKKAKEIETKAAREAETKKAKEPEVKKVKETEVKSTRETKEKKPAKVSGEKVAASTNSSTVKTGTPSTAESAKSRKKVAAAPSSAAPRPRPKTAPKDVSAKERLAKPGRSTLAANTKPKNPSPLSASPPVNASDFENDHPVHKALSAAPSPAKNSQSSGNSDRSLKRKANELDSNIHDHHTKQPRRDLTTPSGTPTANGKANGATPSSGKSLKRRAADESSTANTTPASKYRKVTSIDTAAASRYQTKAGTAISPGESSSATTSPSGPSLSFRQTVELSQRFQKYYKKYEELYWKLADSKTPPSDKERKELMEMHKKLEDMKRDIKAGANMKH